MPTGWIVNGGKINRYNTNNNFEKLKVVGFSYGILSNHDVANNQSKDCVFETLSYGVYFEETQS